MQVYRGRLRKGLMEVAVKVQRPGVRESIALDVFILRSLARQARERLSVRAPCPPLPIRKICGVGLSGIAVQQAAVRTRMLWTLSACAPSHSRPESASAW